MIPLRDENPTRRFPVVTLLLIAVNVAVFAYEFSLLVQDRAVFETFVMRWAFVPSLVFDAPATPAVWATLVTSMFLHGGIAHVAFNMLYLWIFGNNVEDRLGRFGFLAFYLAAGIIASVVQGVLGMARDIPTLGASGAVAGVLGAYLVLFPRARVLVGIWIVFFFELAAVPAYFVIGFWFVLQLFQGVLSLDPQVAAGGGVAYLAHVGGFVAGLLMALPLMKLRGQEPARFVPWQ